MKRFRLTVIDHESLLQKRVLITSRMGLLVILGFFVLLLVGGTASLVVFTPIREFIPGYTNPQLVQEVDTLRGRVQQLQRVVGDYETYLSSISEIAGVDRQNLPQRPAAVNNIADAQATSPQENPAQGASAQAGDPQRHSAGNHLQHQRPVLLPALMNPVRGMTGKAFKPETRHFGVDILASKSEEVKAVLGGYVMYSGYSAREGMVVSVNHGNGLITFYKNLSRLTVEAGDYVKAGAMLGNPAERGEDGQVSSIHFEIWSGGKALNPTEYLNLN